MEGPVAFLLSLQCMALTPCECEKCWKAHRYMSETSDMRMVLDWQGERINEKINEEWIQEKRCRWKNYTKGECPTFFKE